MVTIWVGLNEVLVRTSIILRKQDAVSQERSHLYTKIAIKKMFGLNLIIIGVEWFHVQEMDITLLDFTDHNVIYFTASKNSCVVACFRRLEVGSC